MDNSILSSPIIRDHKSGDMWPTPVRSTIWLIRRSGKGYKKISTETGAPISTIKQITKAETSYTIYKGKIFKPKLLKEADIKRIFRFISKS